MLDVYNVYCQAMLQNNSALLQVPQKMTSMHGRLYALVQNVSVSTSRYSNHKVIFVTYAIKLRLNYATVCQKKHANS